MRYALILFLISFCSCQFFQKERLDSKSILKNELHSFKWDELDQYPSFEICDEGVDFKTNKQCFESTITSHIYNTLKEIEDIIFVSSKDTFLLELLVTKTGKISVKNLKSKLVSDSTTSLLEYSLNESFHKLPNLYPPIKRSQHVQALFQLPIIIKTD